MRTIVNIIILSLFVVGCKQTDIIKYEEKDGLAFYVLMASEKDSVSYSFANQIGELTEDTIFVKMRITGLPRDYDRKVMLKPVDSLTTATLDEDYKLPDYILPAGIYAFEYPIVLLNTEKLKEKTLRVGLEIKENDDFIQGAIGIADVSTKNERYFKITYNNQIIKPDYWRYIEPYFGTYSNVKYKFMIEILKTSDFRPEHLGGTLSYGDFLNFESKMRKELDILNKRNEELGILNEKNGYKLLDEFGEEVVF